MDEQPRRCRCCLASDRGHCASMDYFKKCGTNSKTSVVCWNLKLRVSGGPWRNLGRGPETHPLTVRPWQGACVSLGGRTATPLGTVYRDRLTAPRHDRRALSCCFLFHSPPLSPPLLPPLLQPPLSLPLSPLLPPPLPLPLSPPLPPSLSPPALLPCSDVPLPAVRARGHKCGLGQATLPVELPASASRDPRFSPLHAYPQSPKGGGLVATKKPCEITLGDPPDGSIFILRTKLERPYMKQYTQ